jgi:sedoheptulose-bisphosphatase
METVAAASYAGRATTSATRSPTCCAAMSFSQSYRPKVWRSFSLHWELVATSS